MLIFLSIVAVLAVAVLTLIAMTGKRKTSVFYDNPRGNCTPQHCVRDFGG